MSSIRSASSNTKTSIPDRFTVPCCTWSRSRPGVAQPIDTLLPSQEIVSNEESAVDACESNEGDDEPILEQQLANMAAVTEEDVIKLSSKSVELFDVEQERDRLCAFGVRKLRAYCKQRKLKGYSTPASAGIDALAEFMLKHQIYARDVEGLFHGSKNVA